MKWHKKTSILVMATAILTLCAGLNYAASFPLPPPDQDLIGRVQYVSARYADTLLDIARKYDLGYEEIIAANPGVDPWIPGEGTRVTVPTQFILPPGQRKGIIINLAELRLYYYLPEKHQVITHPLGIGREGWATPTGRMTIIEKKANPYWRVPKSIRKEHAAKGEMLPALIPPGPNNPLGHFAMRLSQPQYLLHGTNQPWGVGMRVSHGCIRLYPEDIEALFPLVPTGTPVEIINQPYKAGWGGDNLFIEAHSPLSEQFTAEGNNLTPLVKAIIAAYGDARPKTTDLKEAQQIATQHTGMPTPLTQTIAYNKGRSLKEVQKLSTQFMRMETALTIQQTINLHSEDPQATIP